MSSAYSSTLTLAAGAVLICAVTVLWLSSVRSVLRVVATQGIALGCVAMTLGAHVGDAGLIATAAVVLAVKGLAIPMLIGKAAGDALDRERRPLVNVPASLVAAAALVRAAPVRPARTMAAPGGRSGGASPHPPAAFHFVSRRMSATNSTKNAGNTGSRSRESSAPPIALRNTMYTATSPAVRNRKSPRRSSPSWASACRSGRPRRIFHKPANAPAVSTQSNPSTNTFATRAGKLRAMCSGFNAEYRL